VASGS